MNSMRSETPKRILDIVISIFALFILSIPMLLIALCIKFGSSGPVLYWSDRVGRNGVIFTMPKFRTMLTTTPELPSNELTDPDSHITRIGKILRRYSVDEVPQFFSVLVGDMSLVGPRPLIPKLMSSNRLRALYGIQALRPGITGWAQINGRDDLNEAQKLAFDREYFEKRNFIFDLKILFLTVGYVCQRKGVRH